MFLQQLHIINFKNHSKRKFTFTQNSVGFTGLNGVGKTNILDAIYCLGITKSYFSSTDKQCIKHDEDFFRIEATIIKDDLSFDVVVALQKGKRKIVEVNKARHEKIADHIGLFPVVVVAPDDNVLLLGGSEERRKFLNPILSQVDKNYLQTLVKYQEILTQRNALLKANKKETVDLSLLQVYDEQLKEPAQSIYKARAEFVTAFQPLFNECYNAITGGKETFTVRYKSQLLEGDYSELLVEARSKDLILHRSTVGIHKDDLLFDMDERKVKQYGSQGQQKSFLLALKLAQYHYLKEKLNVSPLFLIDDMFDKLDDERSKRAVEYISEALGQVFVTHTSAKELKKAMRKNPMQIEEIE